MPIPRAEKTCALRESGANLGATTSARHNSTPTRKQDITTHRRDVTNALHRSRMRADASCGTGRTERETGEQHVRTDGEQREKEGRRTRKGRRMTSELTKPLLDILADRGSLQAYAGVSGDVLNEHAAARL